MTEATAPVILLLAGEASGDLHGAHLARALRARLPRVVLRGTGGEAMAAEGVELVAGLDRLAVMGFVEVLAKLPFFWKLERRIRGILDRKEVDLVIAIDYPGFNLRAVEHAHRRSVPSIFYIAPQVWAWKKGRAARLAEAADRIAVILPFEEEIFEGEGGRARYVGHPLLDHTEAVPDRASFCARWDLDPERPILSVFPGSRAQEVKRHLSPFLETARRLREARPGLQVALARVPGVDLEGESWEDCTPVTGSRPLLRHSRAALVKSGTTTLEAAIEGTPFVVAYRTSPLTYRIARRLVSVEHVALANLVAGDRVVPEFLQDEVTAERLVPALLPLLDEGDTRERMLDRLRVIRERLGSPGAADRVAEMAVDLLAGEAA